MRKFEIVRDDSIKYNEKNIIMPKRATKFSAGYDLTSPIEVIIRPQEIVTIWTNIKAICNENEVMLLCVRSSLGRKDVCLANDVGVIDADYYGNPDNDGNIGIALKNRSNSDYVVKKYDKIAQIIFMPYLVVDDEEEITHTRNGGYGSTK